MVVLLAASVPATAIGQSPGDGGEFTWTVPDRLETGTHGLPQYESDPAKVRSGPWPVDFAVKPERCDPRSRYRWLVDGEEAVVVDGACEFQHNFESEGEHEVRLEISGPAGEASSEAKVQVEDWLVVSIGDSVSSGEGNPHPRRPRWRERTCHRSAYAGPAQAALLLEKRYATTSVTFVHLACSGATAEKGLLGSYKGIAPLPFKRHRPQIEEAKRVAELAGREIDAIVLSIGANDVHFGPAVVFCMFHRACEDERFDPKRPLISPRRGPTLRETVKARVAQLPAIYDQVAATLGDELNDRVHLIEYFDPTHADDDSFCRIEHIPPETAGFAFKSILEPLNAAVVGATRDKGRGWKLVSGPQEQFREHGYCVRGRERWVVKLGDALRSRAGFRPRSALAGTLHPNRRGHEAIAASIFASLTGELPGAEADDPDDGSDGDWEVERWGAGALGLLAVGSGAWGIGAWWRRRPGTGPVESSDDQAKSASARTASASAMPGLRPDGRSILELFAVSGRWVHRRVETVTFVDETLIRRRVSVDLTLPEAAVGRDGSAYVPLALLAKRPLVNFDLRDEQGSALPHLTREQNGELVHANLMIHAGQAFADGVPPELDGLLWEVVTAGRDDSIAAVETIRARWDELTGAPFLNSVLDVLARSFLVVVPVSDADDRRVLKFAYDSSVQEERVGLRTRFNWRSWNVFFIVPQVGDGGSHHIEVARQPDLEVAAEILATDPSGENEVPSVGSREFGARAHAYVAGAPLGSDAIGRVWMRVRRPGFLRGAPWIGAFTALVLSVAWFLLPDVASGGKEAAALILVVPSILATYLGRPGEHPITSEMLLGARILLLVAGFLSFVCAALLAVGAGETLLRVAIGISAAVCWLIALALAKCWLGPPPPSEEELS